jgi:hypothetical protein
MVVMELPYLGDTDYYLSICTISESTAVRRRFHTILSVVTCRAWFSSVLTLIRQLWQLILKMPDLPPDGRHRLEVPSQIRTDSPAYPSGG